MIPTYTIFIVKLPLYSSMLPTYTMFSSLPTPLWFLPIPCLVPPYSYMIPTYTMFSSLSTPLWFLPTLCLAPFQLLFDSYLYHV